MSKREECSLFLFLYNHKESKLLQLGMFVFQAWELEELISANYIHQPVFKLKSKLSYVSISLLKYIMHLK